MEYELKVQLDRIEEKIDVMIEYMAKEIEKKLPQEENDEYFDVPLPTDEEVLQKPMKKGRGRPRITAK